MSWFFGSNNPDPEADQEQSSKCESPTIVDKMNSLSFIESNPNRNSPPSSNQNNSEQNPYHQFSAFQPNQQRNECDSHSKDSSSVQTIENQSFPSRSTSSHSSFQFSNNNTVNNSNHGNQLQDLNPNQFASINNANVNNHPVPPSSDQIQFQFGSNSKSMVTDSQTQEMAPFTKSPPHSDHHSKDQMQSTESFGGIRSRNQENVNPNSTPDKSMQIKQSPNKKIHEIHEMNPMANHPGTDQTVSNSVSNQALIPNEGIQGNTVNAANKVNEETQPNQVTTDPNKGSDPSNTNTTNSSHDQVTQSTMSKKIMWKTKYNELIRGCKSLEKNHEYLKALRQYIKASDLSPKEQPKLQAKIAKIRDICNVHELHLSEDAFEVVDGGPWYFNVVTENYHLERIKKDEDDISDEDDDDEEEDEDAIEYVLPGEIYEKLYDYQRQALVWFWKIYQSPNGGILGDDMGLGKTVQMSAYLNGAFWSGLIRCVLLIVPVSVMSHWIKELNTWCDFPGNRIKKYHSSVSKKKRQQNLESIAKRGGILITTYGMVQKNYASMDIEVLSRKEKNGKVVRIGKAWDYMVLDEGHKIKNHLIGTSKAVRQIPVHNSNRIILSGTFLQNELSELWSLFDFISEGQLFGSYRAFNEEFATKINSGRLKNASRIQKQLSVKLTNLIKKTIDPYLLRRTKQGVRAKQQEQEKKEQEDMLKEQRENGGKIVSQNPKKRKSLTPVLKCQKRELVIWVKLTEIQTDIYRTFLESEAVKETLNTTKSPLAALTVLKKICDHPFLLSDKMANCEELTQLAEISRDRGVQNTVQTSNKMGVLVQVLRELIDHNHRVLVFSQYKIILSMIEPILKDIGLEYIRMDGDTKIENRQKYVDAFNQMTRINVFLLSTKVGGLGLNLTGSDRVIIYDPAWNPATDAQAVDRSYRIGQVNDVMVYRFVTCGTIEEKIYRRQISKVGLLKSVTGNSNQQRYFSKAELKEVFKLEDPTMSQTQIQFKQLHEHRVGTNAEFDRETQYVEDIETVFGISHHDLLFKTCPPEELEENPELKDELEEVRKRLCMQTPKPKPRNRRNRGQTPNTEQRLHSKINQIINTTPRRKRRDKLPGIAETAMVKRRDPDRSFRSQNPLNYEHDEAIQNEASPNVFNFKFDDNYSEQNSDALKAEAFKPDAPNPFLDGINGIDGVDAVDDSNGMDVDDDEDEATESEGDDFINKNEPNQPTNFSFISNISSIQPLDPKPDHNPNHNSNHNRNNPMNELMTTPAIQRTAPDSMVKRTRTLRKKRNRFLADSDSDDEQSVDPNGSVNTRRNLNKLDRFQFTPAPKSNTNRRNGGSNRFNNAIAMTPMFQGLLPKQKEKEKEKKQNNIMDLDNERTQKAEVEVPSISDEQMPSPIVAAAAVALDEEIEIKDIAKVIRSQPRRRRRKSLANLQSFMDAVEDEEDQENEEEEEHGENGNDHEEQDQAPVVNDDYDSEATESESENADRPLQPMDDLNTKPQGQGQHNSFVQFMDNPQGSMIMDEPVQKSMNNSLFSPKYSMNNSMVKMQMSNDQVGSMGANIPVNDRLNISQNISLRGSGGFFQESTEVDQPLNTTEPMNIGNQSFNQNRGPQFGAIQDPNISFGVDPFPNESRLDISFSKNNRNQRKQSMNSSMNQSRNEEWFSVTVSSNTSNRNSMSPQQMQLNQGVTNPNQNGGNNPNPNRNANPNPNPYLDNDLMKDLHQFSPFKNRSFVAEHDASIETETKKQSNNNQLNISWNFNTTNLSDFASSNSSAVFQGANSSSGSASRMSCHADDDNEDDESTESESDEHMIDREESINVPSVIPKNERNVTENMECNQVPRGLPPQREAVSVSAEQIFKENEKLEQEASILYTEEASTTAVSAVKSAQISRRVKRYRRKSFVPTMDAMDDHLEDIEHEESEQEEEETENKGEVKVCEDHRRRARNLEGFEYECIRCECYLTALEKSKYREYVRLADVAETKEEWMEALEHLMNALDICNSDVTIHTRCQVIGNERVSF